MRPEQYAAHARVEEHHWWFTGRRVILRRLIERVVSPGAAIADVGCGTGGNAAALAAAGFRVLGLDPSRHAVELARERFPSVPFREGDDPSVVRSHLDGGGLLMMADVLEHVRDDRGLLTAAIEAVPRAGHLLLTVPADPTLWSSHDVAFGHHRRYGVAELAALWADAAVEVRLLSPCNARLRPLIALHRRWRGDRIGPGGDLDVPTGPLNRLLHGILAGEAGPLAAAIDTGGAPWARGVSLVAILRRT